MRPVILNPQNVTDALNEIATASQENDIVTLAQTNTVANQPAMGQRSFIASSVQTGSVGNGADITEDTLFTFTLPASSLSLVGEGLTVLAFGSVANNADTKTIRLYFGTGVVITVTPAVSAASIWVAKMTVFKTGSSTQLILGEAKTGATLVASTIVSGTQIDTSGIIIKVTGQASVANANDIVANALVMNGAQSDVANTFATWILDRQKGGANRTT